MKYVNTLEEACTTPTKVHCLSDKGEHPCIYIRQKVDECYDKTTGKKLLERYKFFDVAYTSFEKARADVLSMARFFLNHFKHEDLHVTMTNEYISIEYTNINGRFTHYLSVKEISLL